MAMAERIRDLRKGKGYTLSRLASISGVSQPYLQQIESGQRKNPSGVILQKLAAALGTTVADLMGSPQGIPDEALQDVPQSLRELVRRSGKRLGLRGEDVEMLKGVHFRGKRPGKVEDWELLFLLIKRILG